MALVSNIVSYCKEQRFNLHVLFFFFFTFGGVYVRNRLVLVRGVFSANRF